MPKFAVAFDIPLADALRLTRFRRGVRERAGRASRAGSSFVEAARNVAQVLS